MKVELKKLKINLAFSEETTQFMAEVYINGVKAATADNDGRGGATSVRPIDRELCNQADAYFKSLPKKQLLDFSYAQNLETAIDDLVYAELQNKEIEKFNKKLKKDMLKGLVYNRGEKDTYSSITWKGYSIESLLKHIKGRDAIKHKVEVLKSDSYTILNTNLPFLF